MAAGNKRVLGVIGFVVVLGGLNLLSWALDWGWYFY